MNERSIGQLLSAFRKKKGYTQQEVAEKCNVSNKTVSSWERDASSPDISMLPTIAELYGVTCDELLGVKASKPKSESTPVQPVPIPTVLTADCNAQQESDSVLATRLSQYEYVHRIACIAAIFVAVLAQCAAWIALYLTVKPIWAFTIVVPVLCITLFVLTCLHSRIQSLTKSWSAPAEQQRSQYLRFVRTTQCLLVCLAFFLPYVANLDFSYDYTQLGIVAAGLMLLLLVGIGPVLRMRYPSYYSSVRLPNERRKLIIYVTLFAIAVTTVLACHVSITRQPLTHIDINNEAVCENIFNLEARLTRSDLPDDYVCTGAPTVSNQYAEYTYTVSKNKFRKEDLIGYLQYRVSGNALDETYTVHILYPIWNVKYSYYDPVTESSICGTKQITVTNREYQTAHLEYLSAESYRLSNFGTYQETILFQQRNVRQTLLCAALAATAMLLLYAIASILIQHPFHPHTNTD